MLKKLLLMTFSAALLVLAGCSDNNQPEFGKHYHDLPSDLSDVIADPVVEVFSLTCGHCMNLEPQLPAIKQGFGGEIGKVHVTFNDASRSAAMFFYAGVTQLGETPNAEFMAGLFNLYHGSFNSSEEKIAALNKTFTDAGIISPYELTEAQIADVLEASKVAEIVTSRGKIQAVPTFIVKGKYLVDLSSHQSSEDIANTIKYLLEK
ncbi:thioredoxin domain-containing protein [Vibrio ulleungensis]|uniref:Thioredoxin domain-containing protein n=1 Tax=Vibrio ulleungensis TaxID=2807619 RepID=A0ABS2HF58_9VIBR|nr:thioredoxin domain-containing protein [Vibrio ulleungensis]MBM7035726.1 thioredoxin domain-containing protein [Vibrio ulleungensis]